MFNKIYKSIVTFYFTNIVIYERKDILYVNYHHPKW